MTSVLLTAFEPYDRWAANSSWLALIEFTRNLPTDVRVTTRRYPVHFEDVRRNLEKDLKANYDYAIHLGQAPGSSSMRLESIGINVCGRTNEPQEKYGPLIEDGPVAYRTKLPLADWIADLRSAGVPAKVSYHAGEYLCNATMYLSHYLSERLRLKTKSTFIHLPLDVSQVVDEQHEVPSLSCATSALGIRVIIDNLKRSAVMPRRELA